MSGFHNTALVDLVTSSRKMFPVPVGDATPSTSSSSSNAQLRKIKKPLIEKRRRERINECLVQLKALVLEAMNKDGSQYSKMEKADILEMTVAHLKSVCVPGRIQQQLPTSHSPSPVINGQPLSSVVASRYVSGYTECAREVANYMAGADATTGTSTIPQRLQGDVVCRGLLKHLENCLQRQSLLSEQQQRNAANFSPISNESNSSEAGDSFHSTTSKQWLPTSTFDAPLTYSRSPVQSGCGSPSLAELDRLSCMDGDAVHRTAETGLKTTSSGLSEFGRARCDSGVYSGASSPADDSMMSPRSTTSTHPIEEQSVPVPPSSADHHLAFSGSHCWPMPKSFFSGGYGHAEDVTNQAVSKQLPGSPLTDYNHNVVSYEAPQSHVLNLTTKNDDVWRPW